MGIVPEEFSQKAVELCYYLKFCAIPKKDEVALNLALQMQIGTFFFFFLQQHDIATSKTFKSVGSACWTL